MKKRLLILLAALLCLVCVFALVACDDAPEGAGAGDASSGHVHAYGEWSVTAPASCVAGEETRTCTCGTKETRVIAATAAHSFTAKSTDATYVRTAPTCQSVGVYYYKCANCSAKGTTTFMVDNKKHVLNNNHTCTICSNAYIYFGEYPQTLKADDVTITETQDSRGYYLGNDDAYYAKVTAAPFNYGYTFSDGSTVTEGTVYYFKVEPILWRILAQSDDAAMILCDSIIANRAFDSSINNYAESDIRAWLNDQFYNTAFTALERELILATTVDNSVASTGYTPNQYACENTEDKVFLLSYAEFTSDAYDFSTSTTRLMQTSDYSRATGACTITNANYYGNGCWWLRSPSCYSSYDARFVNGVGNVNIHYDINYSYYGVVPALQIRL